MKDSRREKLKKMNKKYILDSAKELFLKNGFMHTTIDDIAVRADYAKGSIYNYFSSKDEILLHIILDNMDKVKSGLIAVQKDTNSTTPEKLNMIFDSQIRGLYQYLAVTFYKYFKDSDPALTMLSIHEKIQKKVEDELIPLLIEIISSGQKSGEFSNEFSAEHWAKLLIAYTNGIFIYQIRVEKKEESDFTKMPSLIESHIRFLKTRLINSETKE